MSVSKDHSEVQFERLDKPFTFVYECAQRFYEAIGTPRALACSMLLEYFEYGQLVSMSISPFDYDDPELFADDYAAVSLLKKYAGFPNVPFDTYAAAVDSTVKSERSCRQTNVRFRSGANVDATLDLVLIRAKELILETLQKCPSVRQLIEKGFTPSYGPGVSSSCKGNSVCIYNKISSRLDCTRSALPFAKALFQECPRLLPNYPDRGPGRIFDVEGPFSVPLTFHVVPGNRFETVPKNAKTDRPICIEPHVNMVLQKLYGQCIRKRLTRRGINLDTQERVNQQYARLGSIDGSLATLDLSAASDSISIELVRYLLPNDWFSVLDALRSPMTDYDGNWYTNDKFSSMGNGFTFELESLIFWALAKACNPEVVSIYGDDIIIDARRSNLLIEVLRHCGFTLNREKSYWEGWFRESCGADYVCGRNIRPYFLKEAITHENHLVSFANGIRHYAARRFGHDFCDHRFAGVWSYILDNLRLCSWSFGPVHLGDTVVFGTYGEHPNVAYPTKLNGVFLVRSVSARSRKIRGFNTLERLLTGALMSLRPSSFDGSKVVEGSPTTRNRRGSTLKVKVGRVPIDYWTVPPWLP